MMPEVEMPLHLIGFVVPKPNAATKLFTGPKMRGETV
jgi:hypothetical protein